MRWRFIGVIILMAACFGGSPVYAGSGYNAFPETGSDSSRVDIVEKDYFQENRLLDQDQTVPEEAEKSGIPNTYYETVHEDGFPPIEESAPELFERRAPLRNGINRFEEAATDEAGWSMGMDITALDKEEGDAGPEQKDSQGAISRIFRSLIPWRREEVRVQTIPKHLPADLNRIRDASSEGVGSTDADRDDYKAEGSSRIAAQYVLGPGDVLSITVWKDEALSKVLPILPDGMINFPLIGRIQAAGKNIDTLESELNEKISRFVPDPFVSISVQQVNSMLIYMIGKVNQPGRYPFQGNMTVLQALAMAGGLNIFAKKDGIKIIREREDETKIFKFNYEEVLKGENLEQNIKLLRGDIIVAP